MKILFAILFFIAIFIVYGIAEFAYAKDFSVKPEEQEKFKPFKRIKWFFVTGVDRDLLATSILFMFLVAGLMTATNLLVNFGDTTYLLAGIAIGIAIVTLIIIICRFMIMQGGLLELIAASAILIVNFCLMMVAMHVLVQSLSPQWFVNLLLILPLALTVVAIVYMAMDLWPKAIWIPIAAIVLFLIWALIYIPSWGSGSSKEDEAATTTTTSTETAQQDETTKEEEPKLSEEDIEKFTVPMVTVEELEALTVAKYADISEEFDDSSFTTHDKDRTEKAGFFDALEYPYETEDRFRETEVKIFTNPVYGLTVMSALADKKLGSEVISDLNPWINDAIEATDKWGNVKWLEHREGSGDKLYVTKEYRLYAATLCTLLERFTEEGVLKFETKENWCLNATSLNNERRGVKASYQYTGEFFTLVAKAKNGDELLRIGFNTKDKRPAFPKKPPKKEPEKDPDNPPPGGDDDKYNKDKSKGTQGDPVGENDDKGPGPDTNNPDKPDESKKEEHPNSTDKPSYPDYRNDMDDLDDINDDQKTGDDPNTPSTPSDPGTNVDNSGDDGNGGKPINDPTPVGNPSEHDGNPIDPIADDGGEDWEAQ